MQVALNMKSLYGFARLSILTENSIVQHLQFECPDKKFYPLSKDCVCHNMKMTTLGDVLNLHKEIEAFINSSDKSCHYFGLMIKSYDDGTPYLEIKDNYD